MFFVEAFRTTGDERWLAAARAGARWMDAHLDESTRRWAGCGLLTGVGGWAVVLHELAAAARDEHASALVRRVLETVAAHASVDGDGVLTVRLFGVSWRAKACSIWQGYGVHLIGQAIVAGGAG